MAFTMYHVVLIVVMLVCGSFNTLSTKWADESKACGVYEEKGKPCNRKFDHPFVQAVTMFIGEFLCFIGYWMWRLVRPTSDESRRVPFSKWFVFIPPAMCDMLGTSIVYIALNLTYASSFQMLRGAVIVFTGLLSVAFIGRTITSYQWLGMVVVICGLVLVGLADFIFGSNADSENTSINGILAGDLLIILAQIITATQMVYEEKYIKKHNVPALLAVGLEGLFGMVILGTLLIPMYYIPASKPFSTDPDNRLENSLDAFVQIAHSWQVLVAVIGGILSIALFNFSGISITKEMNATTRMLVDSCRTVIIWVVSLAIKWQPFGWRSFLLQLAGFLLLVLGLCIYNDVVCGPLLRTRCCPAFLRHRLQRQSSDEDEPLMGEPSARHIQALES